MVDKYGRPQGLKAILIERQVDVRGMKLEEMRALISTHPDFRDEQPEVANLVAYFYQSFMVNLKSVGRRLYKRYVHAQTNYTIQRLRAAIPKGLNSVTLDNIQNYFRKARNYMFAYLEGYSSGNELEIQVKRYKYIFFKNGGNDTNCSVIFRYQCNIQPTAFSQCTRVMIFIKKIGSEIMTPSIL